MYQQCQAFRFFWGTIFLSFIVTICSSCSNSSDNNFGDSFKIISGRTMGTTYHIKIVDPVKDKYLKILKEKIEKSLEEINNLMSTYRKDSELSRFNRLEAGKWFKVDPKTYNVIKASIEVNKKTGGAFDITVGPLVNLWGFGSKIKLRTKPPKDWEIEKIKKEVGSENLILHTAETKLKKIGKSLYLDLAAIAKGYGVDVISMLLAKENIDNYMVEIGGEVRLSGYRNRDKERWRIGIEKPVASTREKGMALSLTNISVATSGDYRNFFEYRDKRYSHTIDPRTGWPVAHKMASVTVFAKNCMMADAYATALNVMGPSRGILWADKNNIKSIFYIKTENGFKKKISTAMQNYLKNSKSSIKDY